MKNVITAILSSDHMKPQKQESDTGGGRKTGAIAAPPSPALQHTQLFLF